MNTESASFLEIRDVVKDFGAQRVVDHVSVDIARGEIFALLGPSGCGKTTLLRMLAGFETPSAGTIRLLGRDLVALPPYERPLNMMFQSYALFPHLTVAENVAFGLRREGRPAAEVAQRVEAMLALVQLAKFAGRKPHQLSGGQQQRVALARSLARRPQLLLLDEPLGALDRKLREETQIELVNIVREVGVTCVMVTHDQEEAMTMATRLAVMSEGRLLQVGSPDAIYETPANRFVADFIGNVNLMDGTLAADRPGQASIRCADCTHRVDHGSAGAGATAVSVALRPEKIRLEPAADASTAPNTVVGTVRDVGYFGSYTVYRLQLDSGAMLKASVANGERRSGQTIRPGERVRASWPPSAPVVLTS